MPEGRRAFRLDLGAAGEAERRPRSDGGRRLPTVDAGFVGVVQLPRDGVEHASETVLGDSPAEKRIGGEGAEGVIADFGVRRRGALADEIEISIGGDGPSTQQNQPNVDSEFALDCVLISEASRKSKLGDLCRAKKNSHHASGVTENDTVSKPLQAFVEVTGSSAAR